MKNRRAVLTRSARGMLAGLTSCDAELCCQERRTGGGGVATVLGVGVAFGEAHQLRIIPRRDAATAPQRAQCSNERRRFEADKPPQKADKRDRQARVRPLAANLQRGSGRISERFGLTAPSKAVAGGRALISHGSHRPPPAWMSCPAATERPLRAGLCVRSRLAAGQRPWSDGPPPEGWRSPAARRCSARATNEHKAER